MKIIWALVESLALLCGFVFIIFLLISKDDNLMIYLTFSWVMAIYAHINRKEE